MRSFSVQIIAVVGMIFSLVLIARYWDERMPPVPSMPSLPSLETIGGRFSSLSDPETVCPAAPSGETDTSAPSWSIPPAPRASDFPQAALDEGLSGVASVKCAARTDGRVIDCQIVEETPAGYGFGESAIRIVQRGCLTPSPLREDGAAFTVRIPFTLSD